MLRQQPQGHMMVNAVVGIARSDGSFSIPEHRKLGPAIDVVSPYGIRNKTEAKKHLTEDITGLVFISAETDHLPQDVGEESTAPQREAVLAEYMSRNADLYSPRTSASSQAAPISSIRPGAIPAGSREAATMNQPENELLLRYQTWLGRTLIGKTLRHPESSVNLRIDAYDEDERTLIEAKSSAHRTNVLHGIGQLLDYGRLIPEHERKLLLLPAQPERDLLELCAAYDITVCCEDELGFSTPTH